MASSNKHFVEERRGVSMYQRCPRTLFQTVIWKRSLSQYLSYLFILIVEMGSLYMECIRCIRYEHKRRGKQKTNKTASKFGEKTILCFSFSEEKINISSFEAVLQFSQRPLPVNLFTYLRIRMTPRSERTFRPISADEIIEPDDATVSENEDLAATTAAAEGDDDNGNETGNNGDEDDLDHEIEESR